MATVSTLLSDLGNLLNDTNEERFTSPIKLTALNNAQNELVLRIMGASINDSAVYDLLSEIIEEETKSVSSTGFQFSSLTNRNIFRNGFINSKVNLNGKDKFPSRYSIDKIGLSQNSFLAGSDLYPVSRILTNKYFLDISIGSYPKNVTFYYVGEPYEMAAADSGSGKTQLVATSDLNVLFHDLLTIIAERELRRQRGDQSDFQESAIVGQFAELQINSLITGQIGEPKSKTIGQFVRKNEEFMDKRLNESQGQMVQ